MSLAHSWLWQIQLLSIVGLIAVRGFNLDVDYPLVAKGEPKSYFGYSIAVQDNNRLLVGAPQYNISSRSTGTLYNCRQVNQKLNCDKVNIVNLSQNTQWFGATVISRNNHALVCGPRSDNYVMGSCYYSPSGLSFVQRSLSTEALCQVGFSAAFSSDGSRFYAGGPGCQRNAGRIFATTSGTANQGSTADQVNKNEKFLFSYAMALGRINRTESIAVSLNVLQNGSVMLMPSEYLEGHTYLTGKQSGEQFGNSIAMFDINNDGRDDVVIGAPHHTIYSAAEIKHDTGAVYIFHQQANGTFLPNISDVIIRGNEIGGQFGFAVAAIGDTNGDGYNDLAVGAPYENSGSGVVYIYHGSKTGVRIKPAQIIRGNQFNPPIFTFGFSFVNNPTDFDDNNFKDLIVGAYESDTVVYLPARPVVSVTAKTQFNPASVTLENKICTAVVQGSPVPVACSEMEFCLDSNTTTKINVAITLDVGKTQNSRLLFMRTNNYRLEENISLVEGIRYCKKEMVYVRPDIQDKTTPMAVSLVSTLIGSPEPLSPIMDIYDGKNGYAGNSLTIQKNCGPDQICIPDLQMTIKPSSDSYLVGSGKRWFVDVAILNKNEDAYEAKFFLYLPPSLSFISTDRNYTNSSISCAPITQTASPHLLCELGNPLAANAAVYLRVVLQPVDIKDKTVLLIAETNSTNKESDYTLQDNMATVTLNFWTQANLVLTGRSSPESLTVNVTALKLNESTVLPTYVQFYEAHNSGPSDITSARFNIFSPTHTEEGYAISTLTATPAVVQGSAMCNSSDSVHNGIKGMEIICETQRLANKETVTVRLNARLSSEAFLKKLDVNQLTLTSAFTATITRLPLDQDVSNIQPTKTEISLTVYKISAEVGLLKAFPWWIVVVSAIGAVLVVGGLAGVLHYFGFFKRNRPPQFSGTVNPETVPEAQPLQGTSQQRPPSEMDNMRDEDSN